MKYLVFVDTWREGYGTNVFCVGVFSDPAKAEEVKESVSEFRPFVLEVEEDKVYELHNADSEDPFSVAENELGVAFYIE